MTGLKRLALIGLMAGLPAMALAQGAPPGGPGGPGGGGNGGPSNNGAVNAAMAAVKDTPQETAAKAVVEAWGALLDQGKIDEAFDTYVSKNFVDHSEMARNMAKTRNLGFTKVKQVFHMMITAGGPKMVQKITADDDMVTVQGRLGQDIFRVENGKITDHWDTIGGFTGGGGGAPAGGAPAGGPPGGAPGGGAPGGGAPGGAPPAAQ